MASLTHVCMWIDRGWKRITANEAGRIHPGGTVSARSGLFMCELCGQYVSLIDGEKQVRHFRHSSFEKSKNCPERTFGSSVSLVYDTGNHDLPIRLKWNSSNGFELEIGFIRLPDNILSSNACINIIPNDLRHVSFSYLKERLNEDSVSYLSIGNCLSSTYSIQVQGAKDNVYQFWPKSIPGIDPYGTVFDSVTAKKLSLDADVICGRKYYIFKKGTISRSYTHVNVNEVYQERSPYGWHVYEATALDYDQQAAKFFLDFHCRLTDSAASIQPIWPVYIENPYVFKHNRVYSYIYVSGNVSTSVFPSANIQYFPCGNDKLVRIACNSRQQLISAGRISSILYTYFWREALDQCKEIPVVEILDFKQQLIEGDEIHKLPDRGVVFVISHYDGYIIVKQGDKVIDKRNIQAESALSIDGLGWGMSISIFCGLDCIREVFFVRKKYEIDHFSEEEEIILHLLQNSSGSKMRVSHSIGSVANALCEYPKIQRWLYQQIRQGYISTKAYRKLQAFISRMNAGERQ